jgi:hypothetical protein
MIYGYRSKLLDAPCPSFKHEYLPGIRSTKDRPRNSQIEFEVPRTSERSDNHVSEALQSTRLTETSSVSSIRLGRV